MKRLAGVCAAAGVLVTIAVARALPLLPALSHLHMHGVQLIHSIGVA
jgi:hypothetical protein